MERVEVAMLGPLEVRDGAGSVRAMTGTRLRGLLILLALRAFRFERLAARYW
jgi:hypothetical protein